jgi:sn-glycerol 3-phosphate transport system permease protein
MEKRVVFRDRGLPYLLVAPQLLVTLIFFIWPAGQALLQSLQQEDPFGLSTQFVGLANFEALFQDPAYLNSLQVTAVFCSAVAVLSLGCALLLAVMADRVIKGATGYKALLIWPYAVAPAVAAALWVFLFNPTVGIISWLIKSQGISWNYLLNGGQAMLLVVIAAAWKQASYYVHLLLAGLHSVA